MTAVCDTGRTEMMQRLGADRVIDSQVTDFTQDEQTYDVVLDTVGKSYSAAVGPC